MIGMSIVMLIQFIIITFIGMGLTVQKKEIAEAKEPLKMQESLMQTANLVQTRAMAVATGDENKYSTIAEVKSLLNSQMLSTYPVGSIYLSTSSMNPSSLFGGTWVAWGSGRVPVGINTADGNFNTVEKTGGEASHKLTVAEMPSHNHLVNDYAYLDRSSAGSYYFIPSTGGTRWISAQKDISEKYYGGTTGGNGAHNNLQPYITCYMWKRTA